MNDQTCLWITAVIVTAGVVAVLWLALNVPLLVAL